MVEITILAHHEAVLENGAGSIHIILDRLKLAPRPGGMNEHRSARSFASRCFKRLWFGQSHSTSCRPTDSDARSQSRFIRAMVSMLIDLGQAA